MRIKHFTPSVLTFPEVGFEADKPIRFLCGRASSVYRIDNGIDLTEYFDTLTALGRQIFVAVVRNYPDKKMTHPSVQAVKIGR